MPHSAGLEERGLFTLHDSFLPCSSDKTLLPEFVQRIPSVNYVLQERCPFESDVDPIVLFDA